MSRSRFLSWPGLRPAKYRNTGPASRAPISRSRFLPWPARWPGAWWVVPRQAALAVATAPALRRPAASPRVAARAPLPATGRPRVTVLRLAVELEPGLAGWLADAVLARVRACGGAAGTVALDLGASTAINEAGCAELGALADQLAAAGTRLRLVATSRQAWELLQRSGLVDRLGATAIHRSLRAAVLASYAALPGPGLVTPEVQAALAAAADPFGLAPGLPARLALVTGRPGGPPPVTARPGGPGSWPAREPPLHPPRVGRTPGVVGGLCWPASLEGEEAHHG